ncbi:secretion protein HlyD, partial [Staphylococcus aureus]
MAALGEDFGDWVNGSVDGARLKRSKRFVRLVFLFFAVLLIWAYLALLDEVSTGTGKVVPTSQEQVIQSLEGGVLAKLYVRQDDVVEPGKILAQLDPTVTEATVQESSAKYRAALASSARLTAEVNGSDLEFPDELDAFPSLQAS